MKKILIAYYAHENENIQILVQNIQQYTHGNIYEIKTIDDYPRNYCTYMKKAKKNLMIIFILN